MWNIFVVLLCGGTSINHELIVQNRAAKDGSAVPLQACVESIARMQGSLELDGFTIWSAQGIGGSTIDMIHAQVSDFCLETKRKPPKLHGFVQKDCNALLSHARASGQMIVFGDKGGKHHPIGAPICHCSIVLMVTSKHVLIADTIYPPESPNRFQIRTLEEFATRYDGWFLIVGDNK